MLKPFKSNVHNVLEQREIICSIITLYTAVYFNAGGGKTWVNTLVLIGVILTNFHFFSLLVFCFLRIPNFSKLPWRLKIYEIKYLKFMKILKWITLTDKNVTLRLKDDPSSTDYIITNRITNVVNIFQTAIALPT